MNDLKNLFYYENVSPRLANNIKNVIGRNITFEQLSKYEKILLKRLKSKSNRKELVEMLDLIRKV